MPELHGWSVFALLRHALKDFVADDMITYAAALAFYTLFGSVPFAILVLALLSFFELPGFFDRLLSLASVLVPAQVVSFMAPVLRELQAGDQGELLSAGIGAALWSASIGVRSLTRGLNVAYKVEETRRGWRHIMFSLLLTIGFAFALIAAGSLLIVSPRILQWLTAWSGLDRFVLVLWAWLRIPLAFVLVTLTVAVVYQLAPNSRRPFKVLTPGVIIAVGGWGIASLAFSLYVSNVNDYSATYGSLGTVIIVELYFYLSAMLLLFGAEVNAVLDRYPDGKPT